ncbi:MAG: hypothetical protein JNM56_20645 [Planctomycetia bacterium]|nr:hypothetical protein [Planctomycetia bacterium]
MSAADLLHELRQRGVILAADGERLRYGAAPGVLTPELRQALVDQKADIIALLQAEQAVLNERTATAPQRPHRRTLASMVAYDYPDPPEPSEEPVKPVVLSPSASGCSPGAVNAEHPATLEKAIVLAILRRTALARDKGAWPGQPR